MNFLFSFFYNIGVNVEEVNYMWQNFPYYSEMFWRKTWETLFLEFSSG
jgi:hypothetical protein